MTSGGIVESTRGSGTESSAVPATGGVSRARLVQRLLQAPSLPAFMQDLLTTQAVVVAGTEAAGFLVQRVQQDDQEVVQFQTAVHIRPDDSGPEIRAAAVAAFQEILRPCVIQGKDGAVEIGAPDKTGDTQFCLVTLLRTEGQVVAASAVITRCRDQERARQRLMSMQLVAGYFDMFTLRRTAEQSRIIAQSHQHVLQLASAVATSEGFESAAMGLCNELATRAGAVRVALGWVKGNRVRVKALSHTEKFDKKQELVVALERVMEECYDQEEPVRYDPDGTSSDNVTREAQALSRTQGGNTVLSLPLRARNDVVGVMTLEFAAAQKLPEQAAHGLAVAVDLLAPQLCDRHQNDRWLIVKAGLSVRDLARKTIGPRYMLAKLLITLGVAAVLAICNLIPFADLRLMHRVTGSFTFAPIEQRSLCAPYDGYIRQVAVKPGQRVRAGDLLLEMDSTELLLKKASLEAQARSKSLEADKARAEKKPAEAAVALAQAREALEQVKLLDWQIAQARVLAPIDGEVLKGDLSDRIDAPVKQGDVLFEMAPTDNLRAELVIAERDIQKVSIGQGGNLATTSLPQEKYAFEVERIVPLGEAREGDNTFKVYAKMRQASPQWRPGLQGEAKIDVQKRPVAWLWLHRAVEFVRLKLWI